MMVNQSLPACFSFVQHGMPCFSEGDERRMMVDHSCRPVFTFLPTNLCGVLFASLVYRQGLSFPPKCSLVVEENCRAGYVVRPACRRTCELRLDSGGLGDR